MSYRTGRLHENWNLNSFHNKTGRGISGRYKGVLFRSSHELSFVVRAFQLNHSVVAEPFRFRAYNYLSEFDRNLYEVKKTKIYIPDYLLNDKVIIEIKCSKVFSSDNPDFGLLISKLNALSNFCRENDYEYAVLTEEEMCEHILTDKQIKSISTDIEFFKQRHTEKYKAA